VAERPVLDPLAAVARRLGWSSGQLWTAVLSVAAASGLIVALLPSALHPRTAASAAVRDSVAGLSTGGLASVTAPRATSPSPSAEPAPMAAPTAPAGPPAGALTAPVIGPPPSAASTPAPVASTAPPTSTASTSTASTPPTSAAPGPAPSRRGRPGPAVPTAPTARPAAPPAGSAQAPPAPSGPGTSELTAALTVGDAGWTASTGLGAPAAAPAGRGELPVGASAGTATSRAFVRLSGGGTVLHLPSVTSDPTGGTARGTLSQAAIALCANTSSDWVAGPAQASGPPFDEGRCVTGQPSTDLSDWAFDLRGVPAATRTSRAGWTVVLDPASGGRTFQVIFDPAGAP